MNFIQQVSFISYDHLSILIGKPSSKSKKSCKQPREITDHGLDADDVLDESTMDDVLGNEDSILDNVEEMLDSIESQLMDSDDGRSVPGNW